LKKEVPIHNPQKVFNSGLGCVKYMGQEVRAAIVIFCIKTIFPPFIW